MKKTKEKNNKYNIKKWLNKANKNISKKITFGNIENGKERILLLIISIVFILTFIVISDTLKIKDNNKIQEIKIETKKNVALEKKINEMVDGYPIENMTKYIANEDPKVAAFLIAIARKESAWGKRKPVLAGRDCYNYWGFRLKTENMGSGGHTCFDSPEQAVKIVGKRIEQLVEEEKIDTPKEMVIWKCGYACDGPEANGSKKWIQDVDYYYQNFSEYL